MKARVIDSGATFVLYEQFFEIYGFSKAHWKRESVLSEGSIVEVLETRPHHCQEDTTIALVRLNEKDYLIGLDGLEILPSKTIYVTMKEIAEKFGVEVKDLNITGEKK